MKEHSLTFTIDNNMEKMELPNQGMWGFSYWKTQNKRKKQE